MSAPLPMVPHVCMTCGDARGMPAGFGVPYCLNHPVPGIPMMPWPLDRLRTAAAKGGP